MLFIHLFVHTFLKNLYKLTNYSYLLNKEEEEAFVQWIVL